MSFWAYVIEKATSGHFPEIFGLIIVAIGITGSIYTLFHNFGQDKNNG